MSTDIVVLTIFVLVALALSVFKRMRPFILALLAVWFAKEAIIDYRSGDTVRGTGDLILLTVVVANIMICRKKYLTQIRS